ncbi:MAG: PAS domain S-box protein [Desulfobacteraceae bacterium]|nr:PAS domain S-box protein [Desulfobacteraceae bacterium]MBC2751735.1 PAS domain S-box protein [Desulfobacteraceae bacterium]
MAAKPTSKALEKRIKTLEKLNADLTRRLGKPSVENSRYRAFFEAVNDAIFIYEDYRLMECNQTALKVFGCAHKDEIIGFYPWDFSPTYQPDGCLSKDKSKEMMDAVAGGQPQKFYWRHAKKDGTEFDTEISLSCLETAGVKSFHAIVREITELNRAKEALRKRDEAYRSLFDMVSDALALIEIETGQMLDVNKAFIDLYGYSKKEVLGMKNTDFSAEPEKTEQATRLRGLYIPVRWHKKKDGTVFPTEISARVFQYHDRDVHMAAIRDITERHRFEAQRQRSQKMESLGLLAGGVAHDLNNVLSGIVSYPELLLLDLPEDSPLRKPIGTIQESGLRATAIVEDLLTIARGVATAKDPLNLNNLINDYLISPEFHKLHEFHPTVAIKTNLDSNVLNIMASHAHIRKVIMNLISNASEAIEGKGEITIATANRYMDKPLKGYEDIKSDEYVVLSVSDDGSGISSDSLERIFEPFYTKKVMGRSGTGLGLAVVWNVVQDHQGYIDVKSSPNGTTFELYFPITRDEIAGHSLSIPFDDFKGHGETILVVDDVANQREVACKVLNKLGYRPIAVASGEEAIEFMTHHSVDLLLLDMIMDPGINGRVTYERILGIHPRQKAILVSGFVETDEVKNAQKLGAGRYVKKPYSLEKIGMAIRDELEK